MTNPTTAQARIALADLVMAVDQLTRAHSQVAALSDVAAGELIAAVELVRAAHQRVALCIGIAEAILDPAGAVARDAAA